MESQNLFALLSFTCMFALASCAEEARKSDEAVSTAALMSKYDQAELAFQAVGCAFSKTQTFDGLTEQRYKVSLACTQSQDYEWAKSRKALLEELKSLSNQISARSDVTATQRDIIAGKLAELIKQQSDINGRLAEHDARLERETQVARERAVRDAQARRELEATLAADLAFFRANGCPGEGILRCTPPTTAEAKIALTVRIQEYEARKRTHPEGYSRYPSVYGDESIRESLKADFKVIAERVSASLGHPCAEDSTRCLVPREPPMLRWAAGTEVRQTYATYVAFEEATQDAAVKAKLVAYFGTSGGSVIFGSSNEASRYGYLWIRDGSTAAEISRFALTIQPRQ